MTTRLSKTIQLIIQTWLLVTLVGCKSENKEPQLLDPIYSAIKKEADSYEAAATAEKAKIEKLEIDYNKTEVRSIDRKTTKNELNKAQDAYQKASQLAEYYKIKLKLREAEAKVEYKKAFAAGKDWPDPKEYESFVLQKKLKETSRNWGDRVPKRGAGEDIDLPTPENAGEGGGGGGH